MSGERVHELKTWPEFYCSVRTGAKPFEVRYDDRGIETGDLLSLVEWDPQTKRATGRSLTARVTYRLRLADAPGLDWVAQADTDGEWVALGIDVLP